MAKETVYKLNPQPNTIAKTNVTANKSPSNGITSSNVTPINMPKATNTMGNNTLKQIQAKAETNTALDSTNPEKQAAYNTYQDRFTQLVTDRAREGERLHAPNDWKNSIYAEAQNNLNVNDKAYYNSDTIMNRQQSNSDAYAAKQGEFLSGSRDAYMETQGAMLGQARDQQVAELQKALEDAVTEGKISVRQAEAAFEENKGVIELQSYQDAERTKHTSSERGISNSMQMLGLQAGDNQRKTSMINKNMTDRDRRVFDIKDRVDAIKNKSAIDISTANANYNYGLAGAQGQSDMQYNQQMYDMTSQENNMTRNQQYQLDAQGMGNKQQERMAMIQQNYTLEQFATQQGYNLTNMSVQQKYQLEQMYNNHTYGMAMQNDAQGFQGGENALDRGQQRWLQDDAQDFQGTENNLDRKQQTNLQDDAQNFQGGENALDRGHQSDLQDDAQNFQGGENALDRGHQKDLQSDSQNWQSGESAAQRFWQSDENAADRSSTSKNIQTQIDAQTVAAANTIDEYGTALQRELSKYDPTTPEGKLKSYQVTEAETLMVNEFQRKTELDIMSERIAKGGVPIDPGDEPKLKDMMSGYEKLRLSMSKTGIGISEKDLKAKYTKKYDEQVTLWKKTKAEYDSYNKLLGK